MNDVCILSYVYLGSAVEESVAEAVRFRVCRSAVPTSSVCSHLFLRDTIIDVLNGGISLKLGTNIRHVIGHCFEGFQGQRSKVKFMNRWNAMAKTYILAVWRPGFLVYLWFALV